MEDITQQELYEMYDKANEYGHLYHDLDSPIVPDEVYDALIRRIELAETAHPEWKREDSPIEHVSGSASKRDLQKIVHPEPLLSLEDKFSAGEMREWYVNAGLESVQTGKTEFDVEMKIDGLSVALEYIDGVFVRASTRGDGRVGEDVTENILRVKGIPFDINKTLKKVCGGIFAHTVLRVRAEVVMFNKEFERVNKERELSGEPLYANPRNAAAGTLRVINPELVGKRGLEAIAFSVLHAEGFDSLAENIRPGIGQVSDLRFLKEMGFNTVWFAECKDINDIISAVDEIGTMRGSLPYWTDGAVIKVNDREIQRRMGETSKYPRWAVAYKYMPEQKTTRVKNIIVQAGRTGILTPKVEFEPVNLGGTTVQFATLHNPGQIKALGGIAIGDEIDISKAAEIIPQVMKVHTEKRQPDAELFEIKTCPSCGAEAEIVNKDGIETAYCLNTACPAKKQKYFEFAVSRNVLNIVGMGPAVISLLIENGTLNTLPDIYRLKDYEMQLRNLPGLGELSVKNLLSSIEESKTRPLSRIFAALGIKSCGIYAGGILEKEYDDIWQISRLTEEELTGLNGIGELTAKEIVKYFSDEKNIEMLRELESLGVNMKSLRSENTNTDMPLANLSFVITGTLETLTRNEAKALIEDNGGRVTGSVSKNTSYLLAGQAPGSKLTKAEQLGIPVISENELKKMI